MSEKMFGTRVDDVDSSILNITKDGEDFAWFLSDIVTDKQVEKVVDKLNELSEEKEYFERKKEYFLSKWSIVNSKNIQLRQEIKELKEENEQLKNDDLLFFQQVFNILMNYQHLFNREMADEVLEDLGIELTEWFE